MNRDNTKVFVAQWAIDILDSECRDGCILGLGTGTTITTFIELVMKNRPELLKKSTIITSSIDTSLKLLDYDPSLNIETGLCRERLDLYIDSADEVDPRRYAIKGGGAALLREKTLAFVSKKRILIVDERKLSDRIGTKKPVPVEVVPYSLFALTKYLRQKGLRYVVRTGTGKYGPIVTDNGNIVVDIYTGPIDKPEDLDREIKLLPGVVVTGIFTPTLIDVIAVAFSDGRIEIIT